MSEQKKEKKPCMFASNPNKHFDALMKKLPSQEGKVIAITGCTGGLGLTAAKAVASLGATVVLLNRPSVRAEAAVEAVTAVKGTGRVVHIDCDLTQFQSVRAAADKMLEQFADTGLDVLCNNAGIIHGGTKSADGFELMMQVNHSSHFLLAAKVFPLLQTAAAARGDARIVNQTSMGRIGKVLQASNLEAWDDSAAAVGGTELYQQSKLANVVFTLALHDKLAAAGSNVKSLVAHPGGATSGLLDNGGQKGLLVKMMKAGSQSAENGTCGMLTCMCLPDAQSGEFYGPGAGQLAVSGAATKITLAKLDKSSKDEPSRQILWDASVKAVGVDFAF